MTMSWLSPERICLPYSRPSYESRARQLYEAKSRIVRAGEHRCTAYFGYVESALQSGLFETRLSLKKAIDNSGT
jgi:hypothetical protein